MHADLATGLGSHSPSGRVSELSGGPKQRSFEKLDVRGRQSVVSKGRGGQGG